MKPLSGMKVERRPLQSGIRNSILDAIASGAVRPGQKIAVQPLADLLGVSVTPVREALNSLVSEGVLEMLPGGAAIVPTITREALEQWLWLGRTIELQLIRCGLERMTPTDAEKLADLAEAASRQTECETCVDGCVTLIARLIALAQQPVLLENLQRVRNRCGAHLVAASRSVGAAPAAKFLKDCAAALRARRDAKIESAYRAWRDRIDAAALEGV